MIFEPLERRARLLEPFAIPRCMSKSFEHSRADRALTGSGAAFVNEAIQCLLVGFDEQAYRLIEKARAWLHVAVEESELPRGYIQYGTEALRLDDLAMSNWLLEGADDLLSLGRAVSLYENYYDTPRRDKIGVAIALPRFVEAKEYERAIRLFETTRGLKPPRDLHKVRGEGGMAYVLCLHRGRGVYGAGDVREATQRFLRWNVAPWLNDGHFPTAARWMKLAHWDGTRSRESAREALLRCYDYLAVPRPAT